MLFCDINCHLQLVVVVAVLKQFTLYITQFNFGIIYPGVEIKLLIAISFPPHDVISQLQPTGIYCRMKHFIGQLKVPITKFFYFSIQICTSSNDVPRRNFLIPTKRDFLMICLSLRNLPPFCSTIEKF